MRKLTLFHCEVYEYSCVEIFPEMEQLVAKDASRDYLLVTSTESLGNMIDTTDSRTGSG